LRLSAMGSPLQGLQTALGISVEPDRLQPLAVAGYRDVLDAQIDTDGGSRRCALAANRG